MVSNDFWVVFAMLLYFVAVLTIGFVYAKMCIRDSLYAGDLPHAEQRASLLSLDPTLLGELLGSTDLGDVLDADVIAGVDVYKRQGCSPYPPFASWARKPACTDKLLPASRAQAR